MLTELQNGLFTHKMGQSIRVAFDGYNVQTALHTLCTYVAPICDLTSKFSVLLWSYCSRSLVNKAARSAIVAFFLCFLSLSSFSVFFFVSFICSAESYKKLQKILKEFRKSLIEGRRIQTKYEYKNVLKMTHFTKRLSKLFLKLFVAALNGHDFLRYKQAFLSGSSLGLVRARLSMYILTSMRLPQF